MNSLKDVLLDGKTFLVYALLLKLSKIRQINTLKYFLLSWPGLKRTAGDFAL